jgi:hypothetical protein
MSDARPDHLIRFYSILGMLEANLGCERTLATCSGRMNWPNRGVYFFREAGERRSDTGSGPRIVRVGTHALKEGSRTKLWTRLSQHKGQTAGGGNHRGSIFRLLVGTALIKRRAYHFPTWGSGNSAPKQVRAGELALEKEVSRVIGKMSFLWLGIEDDAGPQSLRGYIEKNSIALLSNYNKPALDPPSPAWLGRDCNRERVKHSGLWNFKHVDDEYDPGFLGELARLVAAMCEKR